MSFGVPEDRDVRVVGREEELAPPLLLAHAWYDSFRDETVVQIVLGLIDDERRVGLQQQEQQHGGRLLPRGELIERLPALRFMRRSRMNSSPSIRDFWS